MESNLISFIINCVTTTNFEVQNRIVKGYISLKKIAEYELNLEAK